MRRLRVYLSVLFLQRFVIIALAVTALVSLLDSLGSSELLPAEAPAADRAYFAFLRLPIIFDSLFVIILFLSILVTYLSLIRRNEIVVLLAAGVSVFAQIRVLAPCLVVVGMAGAIVVSLTSPPAARMLTDWLGPEALVAESSGDSAVWLSEPERLVRIGSVSDEGLEDLTFFSRAPKGYITAVSHAETATHQSGGWALDNSRLLYQGDDKQGPLQSWQTRQTPESLFKLQVYPRFLSLAELAQLYALRGSGSRPSSAYLVWMIDRLSLPVVALGLLILVAPLMQGAGREVTGELAALAALGLGFAYFITDGVFTTLAESGVLNGWTGALGPLAALYIAGTWLVLGAESAY